MKKAKGQTMPMGVIVRAENTEGFSSTYFHVKASFVTLEDGKIRNASCRYDSTLNGIAEFEQLTITCQGENERRDHGVYGWEVRYEHPYAVGLRQAEKMFKSLRTIEKGLQRIESTRGRSKTFGEYVGRVCEVCKIDSMIESLRSTGWYSEGEYRYRDIGEGVEWIDGLIREWQNKGKESAA